MTASKPMRPSPGLGRGRPDLPASPAAHERRLRSLILELWARTRIDWGFAATRLSSVLREQRTLGSADRRHVVEVLYAMIRQARRIDYALEGASKRLPAGSPRELARYLAHRLLAGEIGLDEAQAELAAVDWAYVAAVDARIDRERDVAVRFALHHSLPDWLARRLIAEYSDEAPALAAALNERAPLTLRANTLKTSRDELLARLRADGIEATPTRYSPWGVTLGQRIDVWSLSAYKEGWFEAQDEGSQLVSALVAPPPHGTVIDACAGAGGKTLAVGAIMGGRGRLLATDVDARKLDELRKRARRAGLSSVRAVPATAEAWPAEVGELFGRADRILVDAPCTGTGSLRRNPELRWRLLEEDVASFSAEQEKLAARAIDLLGPGGRLIYVTCSLLRAENEEVLARLQQRFASMELVRAAEVLGNDAALPVSDPTGTFLKPLPHRHGTDGFFAAVLRKR